MAQMVKNLLTKWETWVWSLNRKDALEKGMVTHSSILVWRVPWTEEPGGIQSMELQRAGHDWVTNIYIISLPFSLSGLKLFYNSITKLKSLLMKVKEESKKAGLKLNSQNTKIMAWGPITSWQIDGETMETVTDSILGGLQNYCRWWLQPWN